MYNTLRRIQCYTWDQVINKIYLPSYIPGSIHTAVEALSLRISISIYLHNQLSALK
jgi:hypothetical protein